MDNRDEWRESVSEISASGTSWWWWWLICMYILICIHVCKCSSIAGIMVMIMDNNWVLPWRNSVNNLIGSVRILFGSCALKSLKGIEGIQPRKMRATFHDNSYTTIISWYNPTHASDDTNIIQLAMFPYSTHYQTQGGNLWPYLDANIFKSLLYCNLLEKKWKNRSLNWDAYFSLERIPSLTESYQESFAWVSTEIRNS